jgi:hypothetical protein
MFSLVANFHGRKVIRWGYVILTFLGISFFSALVAAGLYAIATGKWNPLVLVVGPGVGLVATTLTLLISYATRLQRLPILK